MSGVDLCLGTAQFGLPYGITNTTGQVDRGEVGRLLALAARGGVHWLDTAQAYGEAEAVLGACLPSGHRFGLISKLPAQPAQAFTTASEQAWEDDLQRSLRRLGCSSLDGFLLHQAADLHRPDGDRLLAWLQSLQERGLARRIGVSIYGGAELEPLPLDQLQLVQLPLSLYDQRPLRDGTVARLRQQGIAIHARSLYLQGLLLAPAPQWPAWIDPAFRQHHARLEAWAADHGTSTLALALAFASRCSTLEAAVVGITREPELAALLQHWNDPADPWRIGDPESWAWPEGNSLDPRCWPR